MDLKKIEKDIVLIKEKTVTKVDDHYKEFVMIDTIGQTFYESMNYDELWLEYWKNVAKEIKRLLDILLPETGMIDCKGPGFVYDKRKKEIMLVSELDDYMYICYKKLKENPYYKEKDREEILNINKKNFKEILNPIKFKVKPDIELEFIKEIHKLFEEENCIEKIDFESFLEHFIGKYPKEINHIEVKDEQAFYKFMNNLCDNNFFDEPFKKAALKNSCPHFLDKEGKHINPRKLTSKTIKLTPYQENRINQTFERLELYKDY